MPEIRSVIDGPLKHTKYKQAKKRRENRAKRRLEDEERDRQFSQSILEVEQISSDIGRCSKCGNYEVYIQKDGKTLRCYSCKHEWLGSWAVKD